MKKKYINIKNVIFFLGLLLIEFSYVSVNIILIQNYLNFIKLIGYAFLVLNIILSAREELYSGKKIFATSLILLISLVIFLKYQSLIILEIVLVAINCINKDFSKIVKYDMIIKIFLLITIITFYIVGWTNGNYEVIMRDNTIRNSLGFFHPNTLAMFFMVITFEYLYLNKSKMSIFKFLVVLVLSVIATKITDSRTSLYCTIGLIIAIIFNVKQRKKIFNKKFLNFIISNCFLIFLLLSFIISIMYLNGITYANKLDILFNNRISYQAFFVKNYPITLFGNNVIYDITLDNGYLKLLLNFGLIPAIIYAFIYLFNFKKGIQRDSVYMVILIFILIYSLCESSMLYVSYNVFFLYVFCNADKNYD